MTSLDDLILHFLKDVLFAEQALVKALPKMAKAAHDPALKAAFTAHCAETTHHVERLELAFQRLGQPAKPVACPVIKGLIEEAEEVIDQSKPGAVRDAGLIACAQAVEHYEMARYGALIAWSTAAGHADVAGLLTQTIAEEKKANSGLNDLAMHGINKSAATPAKAA
jgi:ferritin-like metal-binding protein YciE